MTAALRRLEAEYFDGRSARPQRAWLSVAGGVLHIEAIEPGAFAPRQLPLRSVRWPERQRHGARLAHLPDGASLHAADGAAWDAWAQASGLGESMVVRAQQSWRATLWACALLALLGVAGYLWGVPAAASALLTAMPVSIDDRVGEIARDSLQGDLLKPSALPAQRQQQLRARFEQAAAAAMPTGRAPRWHVQFNASRIGANALALPGGTIVFTDDMVKLFEGDDDVLVGVFAHELGHVQRRHGMRALVQASLIGAATAMAFGDFSSVLAGVPAVLGQLGYSRDFEREADDEAIRTLRAAGIDPAVMVRLFERLGAAERPGPGIALASHPPDAERIERFRQHGAAR